MEIMVEILRYLFDTGQIHLKQTCSPWLSTEESTYSLLGCLTSCYVGRELLLQAHLIDVKNLTPQPLILLTPFLRQTVRGFLRNMIHPNPSLYCTRIAVHSQCPSRLTRIFFCKWAEASRISQKLWGM
jgi:hypothetical protein